MTKLLYFHYYLAASDRVLKESSFNLLKTFSSEMELPYSAIRCDFYKITTFRCWIELCSRFLMTCRHCHPRSVPGIEKIRTVIYGLKNVDNQTLSYLDLGLGPFSQEVSWIRLWRDARHTCLVNCRISYPRSCHQSKNRMVFNFHVFWL